MKLRLSEKYKIFLHQDRKKEMPDTDMIKYPFIHFGKKKN